MKRVWNRHDAQNWSSKHLRLEKFRTAEKLSAKWDKTPGERWSFLEHFWQIHKLETTEMWLQIWLEPVVTSSPRLCLWSTQCSYDPSCFSNYRGKDVSVCVCGGGGCIKWHKSAINTPDFQKQKTPHLIFQTRLERQTFKSQSAKQIESRFPKDALQALTRAHSSRLAQKSSHLKFSKLELPDPVAGSTKTTATSMRQLENSEDSCSRF